MYILSKRYYLHVTNKKYNASPLKNELDKKIVAAYLIYLVVLLYLLHYKYYSLIILDSNFHHKETDHLTCTLNYTRYCALLWFFGFVQT